MQTNEKVSVGVPLNMYQDILETSLSPELIFYTVTDSQITTTNRIYVFKDMQHGYDCTRPWYTVEQFW